MNSLLLLSGGVDSAFLCLREGVRRVLFVNYGQPAAWAESRAATAIASHYGLPIDRVSVPFPCDEMAIGAGEVGPRVIPGRNALLLTVALPFALRHSLAAVLLGATREDWRDYPDCRQDFAKAMNQAFWLAYGVRVIYPLVGWDRSMIDLTPEVIALTWSCYQPDQRGRQCGRCNSCKRRPG